jgi:salicylate 5-hydroxylase small subunit
MDDLHLWFEVQKLYSQYAHAVDSRQWDLWPEFFTDDCVYKLQPRENYDRGFALATLFFSSKGMLKDRVYGISETIYHDPYYQQIFSEANYAVFRTKLDKESTVFNVGRYIDTIVQTDAGLKFAQRLCVYDSEMIPNSIIYPI